MNKDSVIQYIEKAVKPDYSGWFIGITENFDKGTRGHGSPKSWKWTELSSEEDARSVERHFLDLGMMQDGGGTGTGKHPKFLYIYKK